MVLAVIVKGTISTRKELQQAEPFNEIKSVCSQINLRVLKQPYCDVWNGNVNFLCNFLHYCRSFLTLSLYAFHIISYKHSFCCHSSISYLLSSVQLSIFIWSYSHTNSRLFCIMDVVTIHKLLELGHDVQNRRRVVGGLTTGSWVELSCIVVAFYTSTMQRRVELCC